MALTEAEKAAVAATRARIVIEDRFMARERAHRENLARHFDEQRHAEAIRGGAPVEELEALLLSLTGGDLVLSPAQQVAAMELQGVMTDAVAAFLGAAPVSPVALAAISRTCGAIANGLAFARGEARSLGVALAEWTAEAIAGFAEPA